jgi:hypothetical protein
MTQIKKYIILACLSLLASIQLFPQIQKVTDALDSSCNAKIQEAWQYMHGNNKPYNPEKAFQILTECAEKGDPKAMNAIGRMCITGLGTQRDTCKALEWFTKAADAGYVQAWYNLGMMYKYANGVEQDYVKAYGYFKKAADKGYSSSMYFQGMMLYKGLGCVQDYKAAYNLFREGAKKGSKGSMYMLGLCLRNGYGTERDTIEGKRWLSLASGKGYKLAQIELKAGEPENSNTTGKRLKSASIKSEPIPETFTKVRHSVKGNSIDGVYTGYLITYDWSGRNIVQQEPLKLELAASGNMVTGLWTEGDSLHSEVNATLTDTALCFTNMKYRRPEHYNLEDPLVWEFKKATCGIIKTDSVTYLAGAVNFYLPELMEPAKPMYISLKKVAGKTEIKKSIISDAVVYPNPFSDGLNISVLLQTANDVKICVFDMKGAMVHEKIFPNTGEGKNVLILPLTVKSGTYIVKITCGTDKVTTIVAKQ